MKKFALVALLALAALMLAACTPAAGGSRGLSYIWYVALDGSDGNSCSDVSEPCATLQGAFNKARAENTRLEGEYDDLGRVDHTVNVAAGTYMLAGLREGYRFADANFNVIVVGAGETSTIFDAGNVYGGIFINGQDETVHVTLRQFTIQNVNGTAPDSCINIRGAAEVTVENVTLSHCGKAGLTNLSTALVTLEDITSTGAVTDLGGNGNGVAHYGAEMVINGGSFHTNQGMGIYSSGGLTAEGVQVENNGREGVVLRGTATLTNLQIVNNGTDGSFRAGLSLLETADVTVRSSHIDNNQHGVWQHDGSLRLIDTTVSGNPRTAIILDAGEMRLTDTTVEGNGSFYVGTSLPGAMAIEVGARAILRTSQILGNLNGGIDNKGELFLVESELSGQSGDWATLFNAEGATAIIERSLIADNTGGGDIVGGDGVAVENRGVMNMVNATVSGNGAIGLNNSGSLALAFSTLAFNSSVGFSSSEASSASPWLANNIVAGNGTDCYVPRSPSAPGIFTLAGTNVDSDGSCEFPETYALADLHLDALADNGGPTMTHALLSGSPAIDVASGSCPPNDQRILARPFGAGCDTGAYEAGTTIVRISDETTDFDPEDFATVTPTPGLGILIVIPDKNYNCREGNSTLFEIADTLKQGGEFTPIGIGQDKLWFQFAGPTYGQKCWAPTQGFTLYLDGAQIALDGLPEGLLQVVNYPAAPTATPDVDESYDVTPTATATCYYNQQQQYICP